MATSTAPAPGYGLDTVNISFLPGEVSKTMPLVLTPCWESSLSFLECWMENNRTWMDNMLLRYGAILVRGFEIESGADIESAITAFQPKLNNTYRGTSPRNLIDPQGSQYVFSAAEVPSNYPIAQHIEMSFLPAPPKQLYFACIKPSRSSGGETALADFRAVYNDIPSELKQKLHDKGLRYTRTHKKVGAYFTYDVADMLGWPEMFGTDDKAEVEAICKSENMSCGWQGDTFVSVTQSNAFQLHPITKEPVWFNHSQVFHWTTFPAELLFAFRRTREWRLFFHFLFVGLFSLLKYGLFGCKMAMNVQFGDGEDISVQEMGQIRSTVHRNMVFSRWQKGDLMMIDNLSTSHGRQPTYDKGRKVAVAWADPIIKTDEVVSIEPAEVVVEVHMQNPQEKTPESSLTRRASHMLAKQLEERLYESIKNTKIDREGLHKRKISDASFNDLKNMFHQVEQRQHTRSLSQPINFVSSAA